VKINQNNSLKGVVWAGCSRLLIGYIRSFKATQSPRKIVADCLFSVLRKSHFLGLNLQKNAVKLLCWGNKVFASTARGERENDVPLNVNTFRPKGNKLSCSMH